MSLMIYAWGPEATNVPDLDGDRSFGFERYRDELWASTAVRRTGAEMIPRLAVGELFVDHADLQVLEAEARRIGDSSKTIAAEVFDASEPGPGAVIAKGTDGAHVHDAWGGRGPSESIERYIGNLIRAIGVARQAGCGIQSW